MRVPLRPRDLTVVALVGAFALAASGTHVVQSGETLSDIAEQHDTNLRALVEANDIADPDLVVAGQELAIPDGSGSERSTTTYTVTDGDTLGAIAATFGTTVTAIADANDISNPNLIHTGTELTVSGTPAPSSSGSERSVGSSSGAELVGQRHTVQPGDTVAGIAGRYGIAADDFARWNGLVDGTLYATTKLLLYDPGSLPGASSASSGPQTHTVQPGESLGRVASRYGSSARAVAEASGITNVNRIVVGQELTIPGGGGGSSARCPVPGSSFFNDWGFPRSGGRSHSGIDLFAAAGTPVYAPVSGTVDIAEGTVGGKQFRLTEPDGTLWFGSHMADFGNTGQVAAGDVIGYVGDSGNARGARPHLHFEVHPGSEAVNPYPLLRSTC